MKYIISMRIIIIFILLLILLLLVYNKYSTIKYKSMVFWNTNKISINNYLLYIYNINDKFLLYLSSDIFKEFLYYIKIPNKFIESLKIFIIFINKEIKKYLKKI